MRALEKTLPLGVGVVLACGGGGTTVSPTPAAPPAIATVAAPPSRTSAAAPVARYGLSDLRALATRGSWSELLDHIEDVAPSERDAAWHALLVQAAVAAVEWASRKGPIEGSSAAEALLRRHPETRESKDFMKARAEIGVRAFERCFDEDLRGDTCGARIAPFVAADPSDRDLAFRVGKVVPPRVPAWYAVPAFRVAIVTQDDARCRDADVQRAVVAGLGLPNRGNEDVVAASVALGASLCARDLRRPILDATGSLAPDYFRNVCPFMKQGLSNLQKKVCEEVSR